MCIDLHHILSRIGMRCTHHHNKYFIYYLTCSGIHYFTIVYGMCGCIHYLGFTTKYLIHNLERIFTRKPHNPDSGFTYWCGNRRYGIVNPCYHQGNRSLRSNSMICSLGL